MLFLLGCGLGSGLSMDLPAQPQGLSLPSPLVIRLGLFAERQLTKAGDYLAAEEHARSTLPNGRWNGVAATNWASGFYAGCLWLTADRTGSDLWARRAAVQTEDLASMQFHTGDHDVGFRIWNSFGQGYRLTGDPAYHSVLLNAAQSLATRYDGTVGCTRSWDFGPWQYPVIIDNLMNLELLFWAAQNGGDPTWQSMAHSHALRSLQEHVRPDGSTYHVVDFDPSTGNVLWKGTYQGHADTSTWARGQAWAVYGLTMSYRYTGDPALLDGAQRVADFFVDHLPEDGVPYWDFQAPGLPNAARDSSAAAIAAAGLLELATHTPTPIDQVRYRLAAIRILKSLASDAYLAAGTPSHALLLHGVGHHPAGNEIDVSLIYGDYYFLEALSRL